MNTEQLIKGIPKLSHEELIERSTPASGHSDAPSGAGEKGRL